MLQAPDLIEPVAGFRAWRVIDGELRSPYVDVVWRERVLRAACYRRRPDQDRIPCHSAPERDCGCGIYAYHDLDSVLMPSVPVTRTVLGIVTVWGTVQVHADGLRAEYACLRALAFRSGWGGTLNRDTQRIAHGLGADLVEPDELEEAAIAYGGSVPQHLLPACRGGAAA